MLFATFDSNPSMIQSLLLSHGIIGWVTRGVHLGSWRNWFAVDVDDVFYGDDRWDVDANTTPDPSPNPIRMTPDDVAYAVDWQAANDLRFTLMFNGFASDEAVAENGSDPLTDALIADRSSFRWVNHTYEALDLDAASAPVIRGEIENNLAFAAAHGIALDPHELVTDSHSGLANPEMPAALSQTGVTRIGADASRTFDQTQIGPALTVPRYPSNVYYNTGTQAEALDEYNYLYFEACVPSPVTTCFTQPATWQQYVDSEASIMLRHVLSNDPRPHYVHQSNLAEDRTLYDVLDEVLTRYRSYFTVPLDQPTLSESGDALDRQRRWDAALATGQVSAYELDGHVHLQSTAAVSVPTTGIATPTDEPYGGERSGWVSLGGGSAVYPAIATAANTAPVAQAGSVTTDRDVPAAASLVATDADGDSLTYAIVAAPAHGVLSGAGASLTYTPNAGFVGSDQFTFRASDGALDSNLATVSITVQNPARPSITSFSPVSGRPGTRVTITGLRFTGMSSVTFGGVPAIFNVPRGGTRIAATVPAGATTGPIAVTTSAGTGASATSFVVLPPLPTITGFSPSGGPVGTLVTISGSGFIGATSVQFQGRSAPFTVVDVGTITATVPTQARTGRITVVTPAGTARSPTSFVVG